MNKKFLVALLLASVSITTLIGCSPAEEELNSDNQSNINIESNNTSNIENNNNNSTESNDDANSAIYISFNPYSYLDGFLSVTTSNEENELVTNKYGSMSLISTPGDTLNNVLTKSRYVSIEPVREGDVFEGWMAYEINITTDASGFESYDYNRISGETLYSTSELLEMTLPEKAITYVAKWKNISFDDYFIEEHTNISTADTGFLALSANGGTIIFSNAETERFELNTYSYSLTPNETLGEIMNSTELVSVEKEGSEFTGWTIYEADFINWSNEKIDNEVTTSFLYDAENEDLKYILLENCITRNTSASTEEMRKIIYDGKSYYAIANWK